MHLATSRPMFQLVARGAHRSKLWSSWTEGRDLWDRVVRACPGLVALVLMPDHLHLLHPLDVRLALARALAGHTQARGGPGVERLPPAWPLADAQKVRRSVRYVHLNPCRARLVRDPIAWPFCTHLDACGLTVAPVVRPRRDPAAFHRYVSSDGHVTVEGTELPAVQLGTVPPDVVRDAVSAVTRTPLPRMLRRGPARTLYLAAASQLTRATTAEIAALVGATRTTVHRAHAPARDLRVVRQVLGDPRLRPLVGPVPHP